MPYHAAGASNYDAIPSGSLTQSQHVFRNHRRPREKGLHSADDGAYAIQSAANGKTRLDPEIVTSGEFAFPIEKNVVYAVAGLRATRGPSRISR
jgi:hypothetical protein